MTAPKGFVEHCAVLAGGLIGMVGVPLLFGSGLGMFAGPLADFCKDLFKGLGGEHVPRFNKALRERLGGIDPTKLNHHVRKALQESLRTTEMSMRYWYKQRMGHALSDEGRIYLKEFCTAVSEQLERQAEHSTARQDVDEWLGKGAVPGQEALAQLCAMDRARIARKDVDLDIVIKEHFFSDMRLHFAEHIKNPDHHEARVAFEQLTTDAILKEVNGLGEKLKKLDTIDTKLDTLLAGILAEGKADLLRENVVHWTAVHPEVEVRQVVSASVSEGIGRLETRMMELHTLMQDVDARVVLVQSGVGTTVKQGRANMWLIVLVLLAVCGVTLILILNPFRKDTFALKVQVDQPFDYGRNDVVAQRLVVEYARTVRDTQEVVNGFATFTIPEAYRNDDVVMRLLCQDSGRTSADLRVCDSMRQQLSDKERVLFTSVRPTPAMPKPEPKHTNNDRAALEPAVTTRSAMVTKPACALDGVEFRAEGSFEDKLVLVSQPGGLVAISGEVNRKSVQGTLRASGSTLTVQKGGTLLGGVLTLRDCAQLNGSLQVTTLTGANVSVQVNMRDVRR